MIFEAGHIVINLPQGMIIFFSFLMAFTVTYMVIPSVIIVSKEKHLFDQPSHRKSHSNEIPTLGGAAVFLGMVLPIVFFGDMHFEHELKYILVGMLILFFIGIKDDILIISPGKKLIAEILAIGIIVVLGNIRVTSFHGFLGVQEISYFISMMFSIFMFILVINGFNLIDGIDGLASGVGLLTMTALGVWFIILKDFSYAAFCFAGTGALAAFFRFNVFSKNNKIFLGDTGSLILGLMITIFTIKFLESNKNPTVGNIHLAAPAIAIGLLIVPLIDTLRVFTIRVAKGKSPFKPDRLHLHHRLLDLGFSHRESTSMILGFNVLIIFLSISFRQLGNLKLLYITLPLSIIITSIPGVVSRYRARRMLDQLELFRDKTWIVPLTITRTLLARKARVGRHHKPLRNGYSILNSSLAKDSPRLRNLEPVIPETHQRFNSEDFENESVEILIKK